MRLLFCLFVSFISFFATAQQTLSLEKIMAGNEFIGQQPLNPRFAIDGTTILFDWNPNNEIGASTYTWNINVKAPKLAPNDFIFTQDFYANQKQFAEVYFLKQGNLYVFNKATKKEKPIWKSNERISRVERSVNLNVLFLEIKNRIIAFIR